MIKKLISRGPVQPIPISNITEVDSTYPNPSNLQNQENFELQPIESISRNIPINQINVPEYPNQESITQCENLTIFFHLFDMSLHLCGVDK